MYILIDNDHQNLFINELKYTFEMKFIKFVCKHTWNVTLYDNYCTHQSYQTRKGTNVNMTHTKSIICQFYKFNLNANITWHQIITRLTHLWDGLNYL